MNDLIGDPVWIPIPNSENWRLEPLIPGVQVTLINAGTIPSGMPLYAVEIEGPCGSGYVTRKEGDQYGARWTLQGAMRKGVKYAQDREWLIRHGILSDET